MWDWFIDLLMTILSFLNNVTGDWGLSIILLTFIIRLLLVPLVTKSSESNAKMQVLQPQLKAIQEKYADNPERQAEEMRNFYSEHKFNPIGGCLPLLLQMPIFFALFTVARKVPESAHFFNILPSLSFSAADMMGKNNIMQALPYLALVILFAILSLIPILLNIKNMPPEQRGSQIGMAVVMTVFSGWIAYFVPAAACLYYDASSLWQAAQQIIVTQKVMDKTKTEMQKKLEEQGQPPIEVVRRERKQRPHKKGN